MMIVQLTLVLVIFSFKTSGESCNMGFPEDITMENSTVELDVLPEDTEIIIPSLKIICDGYISHVSVGFEVSQMSVYNQSADGTGVYLQLWRDAGVCMRNYTLVEEVLLPVGNPWPDNDDQSILINYKLPKRMTVRSNDVIGFRTPYDSSVNVLVNTTDQREVLTNSNYDNVLNVTGVPLMLITHRKTCNKDLPNNINVSANVKSDFPAQSVSGNSQVLFPSVNFTCNGIINKITAWYQILAEVSLNVSIIVQASIMFQIWHPISNSRYKLVSEAAVPSAVDDQPIMVDNLQLRFYSGSVVGIYLKSSGHGIGTLRLLNNAAIPESFLLVTNDKPCIFDTTSTGVLSFATVDIEAALDYVIIEEDLDQVFYCQEDDQMANSKNKTDVIVPTISAAITLIITIILLILIVTCCWRRYKSLGRTKSHYDFQPTIARNTGNNKSFVSVRYYRLDSNPEPLLPLSSGNRSYAMISESAIDTFKNPESDFKQICSELAEVEISPDEIELGDEIGSGNFGVVYHGVWTHTGKADQVAVKTLHDEASEEEKTKLLREAATVQQFLHINIIKFYGVIASRERIMVVLEYLPNGNLLDFLRSARPKEDEPVDQLLPQTLLRYAREIGCGMNYLSNKSFIHRDLASRNILLSEENVCKIADFGLSRDLDEDDYYITHGGFIPVKWTAPEALLFRKYTPASDVWSYGVVLYEMWSLGERPYRDYNNSEISALIGTGYRLPPPPGCARHIYSLMIQCWNPVHRLRPTFAAILKTISQPPFVLFHWFEEDKQSAGPQCDVLGAPLESGHNLYLDLQNAYK